MYMLTGLATAAQDEKLRAAAPDQLRGRACAARRAGNWGSSACLLEDLRILRVLRGRRTAQAH